MEIKSEANPLTIWRERIGMKTVDKIRFQRMLFNMGSIVFMAQNDLGSKYIIRRLYIHDLSFIQVNKIKYVYVYEN